MFTVDFEYLISYIIKEIVKISFWICVFYLFDLEYNNINDISLGYKPSWRQLLSWLVRVEKRSNKPRIGRAFGRRLGISALLTIIYLFTYLCSAMWCFPKVKSLNGVGLDSKSFPEKVKLFNKHFKQATFYLQS